MQDRTECDVLVLQFKIVQYVMQPTNCIYHVCDRMTFSIQSHWMYAYNSVHYCSKNVEKTEIVCNPINFASLTITLWCSMLKGETVHMMTILSLTLILLEHFPSFKNDTIFIEILINAIRCLLYMKYSWKFLLFS